MDMKKEETCSFCMLLTKRLLKNRVFAERNCRNLTLWIAPILMVAETVKDLFGKTGKDCTVNPPFYCDYGSHIEVGENFFFFFYCMIIDVAKVRIGANCFMAPNVAIYTAGHPVHPDTRNSMFEYGKEVTIGDNVWIGGNTVVCPGVHIGNNVVIGAGSVVTKDIPDWSVAAGNPCRVLRKITEEDRKKAFHKEEIDEEAWNVICGQEEK